MYPKLFDKLNILLYSSLMSATERDLVRKLPLICQTCDNRIRGEKTVFDPKDPCQSDYVPNKDGLSCPMYIPEVIPPKT